MKYSITKGNYCTSSLHFGITFKTAVTKTVRFSPSCSHYVSDDINKLFGLSDGFQIHKDSIRIGWRGEGDKISLWLYAYSGGERYMSRILDILPTEVFTATVSVDPLHYGVVIKTAHGINKEFYPRESKWWGPRVFLRPYFGGDLPARETIEIDLI